MRERLPDRRACVTFDFDHINPDGRAFPFTASVGLYDDGRVGEVFLWSGKSGTDYEIAARDSAVILSLALQHGMPLETAAAALLKNANGASEGPIGKLAAILLSDAWRP